jgi:hypothetical protein
LLCIEHTLAGYMSYFQQSAKSFHIILLVL